MDESGSSEAAQIKAIMAAHMANNNIMNLVQMGMGMVLSLAVQSPDLTDDFENRLKAHQKRAT